MHRVRMGREAETSISPPISLEYEDEDFHPHGYTGRQNSLVLYHTVHRRFERVAISSQNFIS